jgi:hypothetical protein
MEAPAPPAPATPGGAIGSESCAEAAPAQAEIKSAASARVIGAACCAAVAALSRMSFLVSAIDSSLEVN